MARVTIAGGHGRVALLLSQLLADRGDEEATTEELATVIAGSDAVVLAAGAGPGSGASRKETVDYGAAVKLVDTAERAGVDRYVMVSAMGTDAPPADDDVFSVYLRAKARADRRLVTSDLDWTIVRPGRLTDDPPTGGVDDGTVRRVFEVVSGEQPIDEALSSLDDATRTAPGG